MTKRALSSGSELLMRPVALGALGLWLCNDHLLKALVPGWITGKLSDIAGLIVCPLLCLALFDQCVPEASERCRRRAFVLCLCCVGGVLLTIKLFAWAAFCYRWGLGTLQWPFRAALTLATRGQLPKLHAVRLTMDWTDVLTLPALLVPWRLYRAQLAANRGNPPSLFTARLLSVRAEVPLRSNAPS